MDTVGKVCLELCGVILNTSSVKDTEVLNYSVKLSEDKTAEVVLTTKEDEYKFVLDLSEKKDINNYVFQCKKYCTDIKYNFKSIEIKGFEAIEGDKIDLELLKVILEKQSEYHARCIRDNTNCKTNLFSLSECQQSFLNILPTILDEVDEGNTDQRTILKGIKVIEDSYKTLLKSQEDYVLVNSSILQNKTFVKNVGTIDYRIFRIVTNQTVPLVYDLLFTILSFTDQDMRQHHFYELIDHYHKSLEKNLQKPSFDVTTLLTQIHNFLPLIKLEILKQLCQSFTKVTSGHSTNENVNRYKRNICTAISEVKECILYPNLSREDCYTIIKNKIRTNDYIFLNYKLIPLEEREGYLGDYFKLKIELEHGGEVKLFHFFAKYLPTYNDMAIDLAIDSFKKEEFYYMKFIPELNDLGLGDITNFLPNCYFSRTNKVLIFDDMTMANYKTVPVSVTYSYDMLLMTMKQLAKIHASSLLYEEILSKNTNKTVRLDIKYPEYVEEKTFYNTKETLIKKSFDCAIRTFLDMLNGFPDIAKTFSMEEFKKRSKLVFDLGYEKVKQSDKFRNVLCQGDCWASNILFKTDENKVPIDCRLVDYQLTRYCPLAHDIYFLFYTAASKETRRKFESKLLKEYYSELSHILQKYNFDLQQIYTYDEFLNCCEYMRSQALCHAIIILEFVLFPEEKMKNILKDEEEFRKLVYVNRDLFIQELQYEGVYAKIMKELAEELYEICQNVNL